MLRAVRRLGAPVLVAAATLGSLAWPAAARAEAPAAEDEPLRLRPGLRASGGADFVSLPAVAPGAEVALVLLFGANRVEAHGSAWIPQRAPSAAVPGAGAEVSLLTAGARYCRSFVQRTFGLLGCSGLEAGALLGRATGTPLPASGGAPFLAPSLGARGAWNVSPSFSFTLALDGLVPVLRAPLSLDGVGVVHRAPPATARALLGVEALFR